MAPSLAIADRLEKRLLGLARYRSNAPLRVRFMSLSPQEGEPAPVAYALLRFIEAALCWGWMQPAYLSVAAPGCALMARVRNRGHCPPFHVVSERLVIFSACLPGQRASSRRSCRPLIVTLAKPDDLRGAGA